MRPTVRQTETSLVGEPVEIRAAAYPVPRPKLPRVSVVIVNYNYGRFLTEAVESVYGQSYENVECIVVDNASTDESQIVLSELQRRHADIVVIRRPQNDGQTPASLDGFAASHGEYVIFLDADDYLLPRCIETHIYTHLSVRPHIGLTSGDMLQVAEDRVVVASGEESNRYIRHLRRKRKIVRPYTATEGWPSEDTSKNLADRLHYVPPLKVRWVWSPTSGLCYRRDALLLFSDNEKLNHLRTGTDLYFAFGCSGLSGSVLIDEPLFAYRIHSGNIFTAHAQLDRTLNFKVGGNGDSNIKAQLYLIDHFVARVERFTPNLLLTLNFCFLLFRVDRADVDRALPRWARRSRAAQMIARDYPAFSKSVGSAIARLLFVVLARSLKAPSRLATALPPST